VIDIQESDLSKLSKHELWPKFKSQQAAYGLVPLFQDLGSTIRGVEVGLCLGVNSLMLLESCPNMVELIGVDHYKSYTDWQSFIPQEIQDEHYELIIKNLPHLGSRFRLIRASSTNAAATIDDQSLDFVFIDAEHTMKSVLADIDAWWPKIKENGIISGHDSNLFSVNFAVTSWARRHGVDNNNIMMAGNNPWWWRK